jgi:hypothetical protein
LAPKISKAAEQRFIESPMEARSVSKEASVEIQIGNSGTVDKQKWTDLKNT